MTRPETLVESDTWKCSGTQATCRAADFVAQLDVARPCHGLRQLAWRSAAWSATVLGVDVQDEQLGELSLLRDFYVRGDDLIANYDEKQNGCYSWQVVWRVSDLASGEVWIDVIVSLQTPLLESFPQVGFQSQLTPGDAWLLAQPAAETSGATPLPAELEPSTLVTDGLLSRPAEVPWSYAELLHPEDQADWHLERGEQDTLRVSRSISPMFLEKGVIRRLHARGVLIQ